MWFLLLYLQISAIQGLNVALRGSESPCKGRLEVYHAGYKQWGLVCHYGWNNQNGEVVCRSLGCGNHTRSDIESSRYKVSSPIQYWMDQVKCTSEEGSLWDCPYVDVITETCNNDSFIAVECSGNVKLSLNLNGLRDKCAGVVEFSTPSGTIGVCNDKWDKSIGNKICQELGCGDHNYTPKPGLFKGQQSKQNVMLNCVGKENYIWECIESPRKSDCKERASVICTNHKKFRLRDGSNVCSGLVEEYNFEKKSWDRNQTDKMSPDDICTQLNCGSTGNFTNVEGNNSLTCSGNVKLRNFTETCYGNVSIDVNGTIYGVCYSDPAPSHKMGAVVCRELGCGEVLDVKQGSSVSNGLLSNVDCQGNEESLWHCLANREKTVCQGTKVICSASLDVRLSDGLGRCSGRLEVLWGGSWKSVGSDRTTINSDVVCQHLNCGKSTQIPRELFIEGEQQQLEWLWNVKCTSSSAKLNECFVNTNLRPPRPNEKSTEVICKKEELMFFEGNLPCKGSVLIESFDTKNVTLWLPEPSTGENKTMTHDICSAMDCGKLQSFESKQAIVTCSGSVNVLLAETCWGTVKVCRNDKCGGVCRNTWRTNEDSKMICEDLGCGRPVQNQITSEKNGLSVSYYSVYCSEKMQNMKMCKFIPNKDSVCKTPAQVICTESVKAKLDDPRDKCAGNVLLYYAGKWTPVCQEGLDTNLKNAICEELVCGKSENDLNVKEGSEIQGLSGIKCLDNHNSVSKCDFSKVSHRKCTVGYLKCTAWERLFLYKKEGKCSGPVYGLREGQMQHVSGNGWGREEGQKLCEYLQCGNYKSHSTKSENKAEWWKKTYNCSGKTNFWDCERNDQPIKLPQQLNIKCDREPPNIMLSENCTGSVLIDNDNVCASHWSDQMSDNLCNSLNCGKAIKHWSTTSAKNCWHFSCTGKETSVWQCSSKKERCEKILYVACEEGAKFSSTEKCGGKLGIRYEEQWEYVCGDLTEVDAKKVCGVLKCNDSQELLDEQKIAEGIKVTIKCPTKHYRVSQCIQYLKNNQCKGEPAKIKCEGYIPKVEFSLVSLILGLLGAVLGLVILILMWMNRKRLLLALRQYRNKTDKDINSDVNEMDKMGTEDGDHDKYDRDDYEDVDSLMEKSGEEDEDYRKRGSSGTEYDDIEGQANGISPSETHHDDNLDLPLLPKRPENILDHDTYELEMEEQEDDENYDDVKPIEDASNENAGTTGTQARLDVDSDAGPGADATAEVEVHAQPEY